MQEPAKVAKGERHNMLTYVGDLHKKPASRFGDRTVYGMVGHWRCDCGRDVFCLNRSVLSGRKKSCGCLRYAKGEAWYRGRRVKTPKQAEIPRRVPEYLVLSEALPGGRIFEVSDLSELSVWHSRDGVDVQYDGACLCGAYRRADGRSWEPMPIPALAGILEQTPGTHVWRKESMPPPDIDDGGWEVVA